MEYLLHKTLRGKIVLVLSVALPASTLDSLEIKACLFRTAVVLDVLDELIEKFVAVRDSDTFPTLHFTLFKPFVVHSRIYWWSVIVTRTALLHQSLFLSLVLEA